MNNADPDRVDENVFLFVPNLIGYARVVLAAASLCIMPTHPKACTALYFLSSILDAVDGQAARALGQTSKFGAVLDMVTDRYVDCSLVMDVIVYKSCGVAYGAGGMRTTIRRWALTDGVCAQTLSRRWTGGTDESCSIESCGS